VELIASDTQAEQARGRQVLRNVLALQDSISTSPTFVGVGLFRRGIAGTDGPRGL